MAKPRNKIVDYVVYLLSRTVAGLLLSLPPETLYAAARALGDLLFLVDARHRRLALEQIGASFPDWPARRVRRVARQSLRSIAKLALETAIGPRLMTLGQWRRRIRLRNVAGVLRLLMEQSHGLICVTGHYGNWEVGGLVMARLGLPVVAVARPLDNPYLDRYVRSLREGAGLRIVDKVGAAGPVASALGHGGWVCFVADQDAGRKGEFVDFFGRPASTYRSIAVLARHYQVPIVVGAARRLADNFTFEVAMRRMIMPDEWADKDDPVRWITQTFTAELEALVRQDPEQYFGWVHRRWKHAPGAGSARRQSSPAREPTG